MIRPGTLARGLLLALIVALFVYPLLRVLVLPLQVPAHGGGDWRAVADSVGLALATATIAAPLGALLAAFVLTRSGPLARAASVTLWALFLAPSYVLTTGWMIVFATPALRLSLIGQAFFGPAGLIALYVVKAVPFAAFVARASLGGAGAALAEAARVHALPWRRRAGIALRLAAPALATGFAIAAIETMQEFGIPATLGTASRMPILTYAIYRRLAEIPTDFAGAAALCWRLIAIALAPGAESLAVRRQGAALRGGRGLVLTRRRPGWPEACLVGAVVLVLGAVGIGIPAIVLAARALAGFSGAPAPFAAVARSLGFGIVAGAGATAVAVGVLKLRAGGAGVLAGALDALLLANMAVPGLVLGAGYILAFNSAILPLYGTTALLLIAYAAGTIPLALRMARDALGDLDHALSAAARLHGLGRATRAIDIEAALLAEPLGFAFLLVCGAIMFELPISELLYPPGATPLGVAIVTLDQMGRFAAAARVALAGLAAMAGFAVLVLGGLRLLAAPRRAVAT